MVLTIALVIGGASCHAGRDGAGADASGPYAEFTRSELRQLTRTGRDRNPVQFPRDLPTGTADSGESGFFMLNKPVTDDSRRHAGEVWLSTYDVSALPPATGNLSGYEVYQEWRRTPERHRPRCSTPHTRNQTVVRRVGDDTLTICLGPSPTKASREYWSTVAFTSDLSEVEWLRDGDG